MMNNFGVAPPWFESDRLAFNFYALETEKQYDKLVELGNAIRIHPQKRDPLVQNTLAVQILGCELDRLSKGDLATLTRIVNK